MRGNQIINHLSLIIQFGRIMKKDGDTKTGTPNIIFGAGDTVILKKDVTKSKQNYTTGARFKVELTPEPLRRRQKQRLYNLIALDEGCLSVQGVSQRWMNLYCEKVKK